MKNRKYKRIVFILIFIAIILSNYYYSPHVEENWVAYGPGGRVNIIKDFKGKLFLGMDHVVDYYSSGVYVSSNFGKSWVNSSEGLGYNTVEEFWNCNNKLYLRSWMGIYSSSDEGKNWFKDKKIYFPCDDANIISYSGDTLIVGNYNNVSISCDAGITWVSQLKGRENRDNSNWCKTDKFAYFSKTGLGVRRYEFKSKQFIDINSGLPNKFITSICNLGSTVFVSLENQCVYKTTNSGKKWIECNTIYPFWQVDRLISANDKIYAISDGSLIVSTNGEDWQSLKFHFPYWELNNIQFINGVYFAFTSKGLFRSNDGLNWINSSTGIFNIRVEGLDLAGNNIYALSQYEGLYISRDNGVNWSPVLELDDSFHFGKIFCLNDNSSIILNRNTMYVGNAGGLNWRKAKAMPYQLFNVNSFYKRKNIVFAALKYEGIMKSCDGGFTWKKVFEDTTRIPNPEYQAGINKKLYYTNKYIYNEINSIVPYRNKLIGLSNFGLLSSDDEGEHWKYIKFPYFNKDISNLHSFDDKLFIIGNKYIIVSEDGAGTWKYNPTGDFSETIDKCAVYQDKIYFLLKNGKIVTSDNLGKSWKKLNTPPFDDFVYDFKANSNKFFITSRNGGVSILSIPVGK